MTSAAARYLAEPLGCFVGALNRCRAAEHNTSPRCAIEATCRSRLANSETADLRRFGTKHIPLTGKFAFGNCQQRDLSPIRASPYIELAARSMRMSIAADGVTLALM